MSEETKTNVLVRPKDAKFDVKDLVVVKNLHGLGYNPAEIGMILGYADDLDSLQASRGWKISAVKTLGDEARNAIQTGLEIADSLLVKDLIEQATGYEYTEVQETFKYVDSFDPMTGTPTTKKVKTGEKHTTKRVPGNAKLAELLACNRLPDLFKKVSEVKQQKLEANITGEMTDQQIDRLVGRLLQAVNSSRPIEATIVETDNEA